MKTQTDYSAVETSAMQTFKGVVRAAFWFLFVLIAIAYVGMYLRYRQDNGYVSHTIPTSISAQSEWLVGESKECSSSPIDQKTATYLKKQPGDVTTAISCDDGPQHTMPVTFYGRVLQPEHTVAFWKCTRDTDSFTCKQTGAL